MFYGSLSAKSVMVIYSVWVTLQASVIVMSQNCQEAKDPLCSQSNDQIHLKAELEIPHLHEKLEPWLSYQWERLAKIQEIQLDLWAEMSKKNSQNN